MSVKIKSILSLALPIILSLSLAYYMQAMLLSDQETIKSWLLSFGPWIILAYVLLQSLAVIIAPIGGFAFLLTMIAIFGPGKAIILAYLTTTPLYCVNFYIARRFGRPIVQKIIGNAGLKTVDHFAQDAGTPTLIILRVFQGMNFDYISYGIGLTNIPFKTFLVVNILGAIPSYLILYFIISRFDNLLYSVAAFYVASVVLAGAAILSTHLIRKHKNFKKSL